MHSLAELLAQKEELEQKIKDIRNTERKGAIANARAIIAEYELSVDEVFPSKQIATRKSSGSVAPKYRNQQTGETWSGRGRSPKWLEGKNKEDFAI